MSDRPARESDGDWKSSLRLTFAFILAVMVTLTALVIISVSYVNARSNTLAVSRSIVGQVAEVTHEKVFGFLSAPRMATELTAEQIRTGVVRIEDGSLEAYLFNTMATHPRLTLINYGDEHGRFVMVKRMADGSLATKEILVDEAGRAVRWTHREPGDPVTAVAEIRMDPEDSYDPRLRPWYKSAKRVGGFAWTDAYVFYTDKAPGITAAMPVIGTSGLTGVVSADIGLSDFSTFLDALEVGHTGVALLLDDKGRLVASPVATDLVIERHTEDATTLELRPAVESGMPEVVELARLESFWDALEEEDRASHTVNFRVGERPFMGMLRPISLPPDKKWTIAVVAPEDDFLADVKRTNRLNVMVGVLFCLAALIASLLLARWISRSLQKLVVESTRIQALQFDDPVDVRSPFREIYDVLDAFDGMKAGLRAFQRYMPLKLVRLLLERHEEPALGSDLQRVTIYFSDIEGFTTIAEKLDPDTLAVRLGDYLGTLTHSIQDHQGTVVQYIGDAIMAFWGAPLPVPDHPVQACKAALECQRIVDELAAKHPDTPRFPTRMGIHTAEVAVGHFGATDRMYYGAIGDGVNIASRLEGSNKIFGTSIIVSQDTVDELGDTFETRRVDRVILMGRGEPTAVYELLGVRGAVDDDLLRARDLFEEGLDLYWARQWDAAIERFAASLALRPGDEAARLFTARCEACRADPPPESWSGAYVMTTK